MRKDLKIGMAIGAVLLVVLIVYIAVPSNEPADVAQNAGAEQQSADVQTEGTDPAAQPDEPAAEPQQPAEPAVADSGATGTDGTSTDVFSEDATAPAGDETAAAGSNNTNWDLLLSTGQMPSRTVTPSLRATNTVAPAAPERTAEALATPEAPAELEVTTAADGTPIGTAATGDEPSAEPASGDEPSAYTIARDEDTDTGSETTTTGGARTHKVKSGETFSSIAKAVYKDARHYLAIEAANPNVDPRRLRPGTVITLPDLSAAQTASARIGGPSSDNATTSGRSSRSIDPKSEYKVKRGDSLYKIAVENYGTSNMVDDLYEANRETIGPDSSKLKLGMVLKLPPNPNAQASSR